MRLQESFPQDRETKQPHSTPTFKGVEVALRYLAPGVPTSAFSPQSHIPLPSESLPKPIRAFFGESVIQYEWQVDLLRPLVAMQVGCH